MFGGIKEDETVILVLKQRYFIRGHCHHEKEAFVQQSYISNSWLIQALIGMDSMFDSNIFAVEKYQVYIQLLTEQLKHTNLKTNKELPTN